VATAVVIPAIDERPHIAATLDRVLDEAALLEAVPNDGEGGSRGSARAAVELVVVDGGSRDGTPEIARARGARVVESAPGRARQLQAGLDVAKGEVVLFLHADTLLPRGWSSAVARALADPACVAGAFALRFERSDATRAIDAALTRVERGARARARWFGLPFGDQAIFARRAALRAIGGVPQTRLFEDVDLAWRLRAHGRLALLRECATTSPRRYVERGVARTVLQHAVALAGWATGAPRAPLARWLAR